MARPVFSSQLMQVVLAPGDTATYSVLPLTVVVVRDVLLTVPTIFGSQMTFALALGLDANVVLWQFPQGYSGTRHLDCRAVLEPGDEITASWADSGSFQSCHVHISGYTLTES